MISDKNKLRKKKKVFRLCGASVAKVALNTEGELLSYSVRERGSSPPTTPHPHPHQAYCWGGFFLLLSFSSDTGSGMLSGVILELFGDICSIIGYCSWDWGGFEINLVKYSELSVTSWCRYHVDRLSNWGLMSVERRDWMSVWAARVYSTAVSGLKHNSTKHIWCELPTWLLSSFL